VPPDPFRGMGAWRSSTETQQSGHAPKSEPEVKNGRSGAEDVPAPLSRGGPKWRDNYPEEPDHLVAPNRLQQSIESGLLISIVIVTETRLCGSSILGSQVKNCQCFFLCASVIYSLFYFVGTFVWHSSFPSDASPS